MRAFPFKECYAMLQRYEIPVAKEELDRNDSLNFSWKTLREKAFTMQCHLTEIQPNFKGNLQEKVLEFTEETSQFYDDYEAKGPLSPDKLSDAREAATAMHIFQVCQENYQI